MIQYSRGRPWITLVESATSRIGLSSFDYFYFFFTPHPPVQRENSACGLIHLKSKLNSAEEKKGKKEETEKGNLDKKC